MKEIIQLFNKSLAYITCLMAAVLIINTSCDSHEEVDLDLHIGYVLCSDHRCMTYTDYLEAKSEMGDEIFAVAVVFAEKDKNHPALAVSLNELSGAFCDSLGIENGTSCKVDTCDGYSNTVAMYQSYISEKNVGCPIAMKCFDTHYYNQSQYIPSVEEMRLLSQAAPAINPIIRLLGGQEIKTTGYCWYWTSTEVEGNKPYQAWLCSAREGGIQETPKTEDHQARPILQLNYPKGYPGNNNITNK